jgi:hypothetical protein
VRRGWRERSFRDSDYGMMRLEGGTRGGLADAGLDAILDVAPQFTFRYKYLGASRQTDAPKDTLLKQLIDF